MITNFKVTDNTDIGSLFCNVTLDQTINGCKSFSTVPIVGTVIQSNNSGSAASTGYVRTAISTLSTSSNADITALKESYINELNALKAYYINELNALKTFYIQEISSIKMTVERSIITGSCPGCYLMHQHTSVPIFYSVPDMKVYAYSDDETNIIDYIIIMPGYKVAPYVEENYGGDGINPTFFDCTNFKKPIIRYFSIRSSYLTRSFRLYYNHDEVEVLGDAGERVYVGG